MQMRIFVSHTCTSRVYLIKRVFSHIVPKLIHMLTRTALVSINALMPIIDEKRKKPNALYSIFLGKAGYTVRILKV